MLFAIALFAGAVTLVLKEKQEMKLSGELICFLFAKLQFQILIDFFDDLFILLAALNASRAEANTWQSNADNNFNFRKGKSHSDYPVKRIDESGKICTTPGCVRTGKKKINLNI